MLDPKTMTQFLNSYIGSQIKSEIINTYVNKAAEEFLKGLPEPLSLGELPKLQGEVYDKFRELLNNIEHENDPIMELLRSETQNLGIHE